jgi:CheY-like chemotaxis protein
MACRTHAGAHWIEVWDTGVGIPADKTALIFEEFTQLGDAVPSRGSGLGLAIVAKASELLGLPVRVHSRLGRGSVFAIQIPTSQAHLPNMDAPALPDEPVQKALRIAMVEDNPELRAAMVLALESLGHTVIAAENGQTLLQHLGGVPPQVVVSDYRLADGETGFQVIDAARKAFGADLPALIVTGDTDPTIIRRMVDQGIAVHFKPLQIANLQTFITQAIERRTP